MQIVHIVKPVINVSNIYLQPARTSSKNICVFFCFLVMNVIFLHAQPLNLGSSVKHKLRVGPLLSLYTFIEKPFSSRPYSGTMAGLGLDYEVHTNKAFHELSGFFSTGTTSPGSWSQSDASIIFAGMDYSHLYAIAKNKNGRLQWLAGGAVSYLYTHRNYSGFINNNSSFESVLSLGAVVKVDYTFKQLAGFSISDKLVIPVIALLLQPSFGSQYIEGDENAYGTTVKTLVDASRLVSLGNYSRLTNCLVLSKRFATHNAVSVEYCIDYYHINTVRPVKNAAQRFVISYQLMF